jgi:hypothetical protein
LRTLSGKPPREVSMVSHALVLVTVTASAVFAYTGEYPFNAIKPAIYKTAAVFFIAVNFIIQTSLTAIHMIKSRILTL